MYPLFVVTDGPSNDNELEVFLTRLPWQPSAADVSVLKLTIAAFSALTPGFGPKSGGQQVNVNWHALFYKIMQAIMLLLFFLHISMMPVYTVLVCGCVCVWQWERKLVTQVYLSLVFFKYLFVLLLLLTVWWNYMTWCVDLNYLLHFITLICIQWVKKNKTTALNKHL